MPDAPGRSVAPGKGHEAIPNAGDPRRPIPHDASVTDTAPSTSPKAPLNAASAAARTAVPGPTRQQSTHAALDRWRLLPNGRVRDTHARDVDRVVAAAMHLWPLAFAILGPLAPLAPFLPLVLWLGFRGRSPFVDDHGREVVNAQLTMLILLLVICVGWLVLVPWMVVWLVSLVRGAVAAAGSEVFRYPVVLRVLR
jgi:uncharacterized Tic20 family protein